MSATSGDYRLRKVDNNGSQLREVPNEKYKDGEETCPEHVK